MTRTNDEKDILFQTFAEITSLISSGKDNRIIFQKILETALDLLPSTRSYLIFLENHRIFKYTAQIQDRGRKVTVEDMPESTGILNWLHREVEELRAPDQVFSLDLSLLAAECIREDDGCGMVISAPLMAKNSLFGILVTLNDQSRRPFNDDDIHLLTIMANQAAIALENYMLYRKLEVESITDGLTGVFNYRFLIRSLRLEIKRAERFTSRFSFLMLDVDNLKEYNDRNGHLSGSRALHDIAKIITSNCREIDLVSKYGGDEFALMLPQTDLTGAVRLGERILRAVRAFKFDGATPGLLTCSIGIAIFPEDARGVEELIDKADTALYRAKSMGKNVIRNYQDEPVLERP
ncbi:MAG TPA: sensor domain-containing diguanylate cyclase [Patescibacteria group bacterium]|nr:sensor domain-containing diguanylate cyclase [Patescibacteria group bacterium]